MSELIGDWRVHVRILKQGHARLLGNRNVGFIQVS